MEYSIEKKAEMTFVGYITKVDASNGEGYSQIPKLWGKVMEENLFEDLKNYMDDLGPVGISYDYDMNTGNFKYMIGIRSNSKELKNFERLVLKEQEYGIFKSVGPMPKAIQETIEKFHNEWLPSSGYRHTGEAEIEIYSDGNPSSEDYISYLWATIIKN